MTSGPIPGRLRRRIATLLALGLLSMSAALACAAEGGWDIQKLMHELGQIKRSQARFVERKYLKLLKAPLVSSGTLAYTAPGRLEKRTLKPRAETLSVEEDRLTIESPAHNERRSLRLPDYPVLWAFVESMRATLGGDLVTLQRFYDLELEGGPDRWQLYLAPRDREMSQVISLIRIDGQRARIERIEVQEAQGDRSVMKVTEDVP